MFSPGCCKFYVSPTCSETPCPNCQCCHARRGLPPAGGVTCWASTLQPAPASLKLLCTKKAHLDLKAGMKAKPQQESILVHGSICRDLFLFPPQKISCVKFTWLPFFFFFPFLSLPEWVLRWSSDGARGGAGVVGNPDLDACRWLTATDNGLDVTTCTQCLLHVVFSLGKSPVRDYLICINLVGGLGVTGI